MSRHIQAYFKTEDDAESARTRLIGYSLENLEVGRLEGGIGNDREILIPIAPVGSTPGMYAGGAQTAGGGSGGVYTTQSAIPLNNVKDNDTEAERDRREDRPEQDDLELGTYPISNDDYNDLQYVLSARVNEQQYEEVVQKLRSEGAYVERFD
ncbi:hypothetical protein AWM70_13315 [Paenibacillus yonginensis]|uniref:Uncharacterized protein n=1 Tax=Paenibacillus yonginensis TaxID=1462996 RepID=A0A1B1N228_9BACL|nr:hypothetical protein [Paenibacillus yonginensis]ANS75465.1 hypothetical protein AWM70_13315 [Paenibacillus yonginensis]